MVYSAEGTSPPLERQRLLDDQELISQAQQGDEPAFQVIYERYFSKIALYLARMVGKNDVGSELAQETFLKVWRALPMLRQTETFVTWLYRIATRVAYDYQRHEKYIHAASYDEQPTLLNLSFIEGPEEQVAAEELLQQALARVTLKYRACIVLYHIEGCSKPKIADFLSIQESSVNTYISLGMEEFRQIRHSLQVECATQSERRKGT
jgi:RNA polymerase sigma-70 factor (ECF subfamily)